MMAVNAPFVITPAYDILLRGTPDMPIGLYHLYIATAEQLCRPHYSMGSNRAVKAKLRKLCDHGYVQFDAIPTKFTRSPYYYTLDRLGIRYLAQAGMDVSETFRSDKEVNKHSLFVEHTLELNNILISAALLKRSAPNYWLESFIHERALKRNPYKAVWQGGKFTLIPDALLDFRVRMPDGLRRMPILIEHDRGSEEQKYFRRRIRAYTQLLISGMYKKLFGIDSITIAFTTSAGVDRLRKMREWTAKELEETGQRQFRNLFYFTLIQTPIDPYQLWVKTVWLPADENKPVSLLEGV